MRCRIHRAVLLATVVAVIASPGCDNLFEPPASRPSGPHTDADSPGEAAGDAAKRRDVNRTPVRPDADVSRDGSEGNTPTATDSLTQRDAPADSDAYATRELEQVTSVALMAVFDDPQISPAGRAAVAVELGDRHYWDAMPRLIRALNDDARDVRLGAKRAIETIIGVGFAPPGPNSRGPLVYGVDMPAAERDAFVQHFIAYYPRFKSAHDQFMRDRERYQGR